MIRISRMSGVTDKGNTVDTLERLWKTGSDEDWYGRSALYWDRSDPSLDGVLGGFGHIHEIDMKSSRKILRIFKDMKYQRALDCGSGIGRISKDLLLPLFEKVDILEQSKPLIEEAKKQLGVHAHMGHFFNMGLQDFDPCEATYDCVWIQWVLGYMTNLDLIELMKRLKKSLRLNGIIVVRENVMWEERGFYVDTEDNNVIRTEKQFQSIFESAGVSQIYCEVEKNFPEGLFPVKTYVLSHL